MPTDALYVHCFHCGRNQRRRFSGTWFTCKHCGKRNPGPAMLGQLLGDKLGLAPATNSNGASTPANGGTVIKSGKSKEAVTTTPAAAKKEAVKTPAATAPAVEKGRSLLGRVMHGS